jgi:drug/metabolite transporter (DMT)-like permease
VHEISAFRIDECIFYAAVVVSAFAGAFFRSIRDREFHSLGNGCALGFTSGLFSFGIVTFLVDRHNPDSPVHPWYYLGVSALIGLLSKEQDAYARQLINNALGVFRGLGKNTDKENESE